MARSVEEHTPSAWKSCWKALRDVVKKRLEEAAGLLQLQELQNRDQILDIVQYRHSSSPIRASLDEASPDLGGETPLENFLLHHLTQNEPLDRQGVQHCQEVLENLRTAPDLHYRVHLSRTKNCTDRHGDVNECLITMSVPEGTEFLTGWSARLLLCQHKYPCLDYPLMDY